MSNKHGDLVSTGKVSFGTPSCLLLCNAHIIVSACNSWPFCAIKMSKAVCIAMRQALLMIYHLHGGQLPT